MAGVAGRRLPAHERCATQGHEVHLTGTSGAHRGEEDLIDNGKTVVLGYETSLLLEEKRERKKEGRYKRKEMRRKKEEGGGKE